DEREFNVEGVNSLGSFAKVNVQFSATLGLTDRLSLITAFSGQRSLSGNLDSSENMSLTGFWAVRSFDEGIAGSSGYLLQPELRYALPDIGRYRHSVGAFTDVGAVWLADASYTTVQKARTQLNDAGLAYYASYEYSPGRLLLLKAHVARTYGTNGGAEFYDERTKGLLQVGFTF